jgi:hypothetical protein
VHDKLLGLVVVVSLGENTLDVGAVGEFSKCEAANILHVVSPHQQILVLLSAQQLNGLRVEVVVDSRADGKTQVVENE